MEGLQRAESGLEAALSALYANRGFARAYEKADVGLPPQSMAPPRKGNGGLG